MDARARTRAVRWVLLITGIANALVLGAKLAVGLATHSTAILSDALHSLTDLANNVLALFASRISYEPPDHGHPYGHRKFETLAVFVLATLLGVVAVEVALRAVQRLGEPVAPSGWGLGVMLGVLVVNIAVTSWENYWARLTASDLLRADARHTLSDVLVTLAVIIGWQLASRGLYAIDALLALLVAGFVCYLAYGLFRRCIPILVDEAAVDSTSLAHAVQSVPGVGEAKRVRSRITGDGLAADVVITIDGTVSTEEAHHIADEIEQRLARDMGIDDVIVHVEPRG